MEFKRECHQAGNHYLYVLTTEHGFLDATFQPIPRWFCIANLGVKSAYRRRGIGRALLRHSLDLAQELDSRLIYAGLVSRESIDVFREVFGFEAVNVRKLGTYTPKGQEDRYDAYASLRLELPMHAD